MLTGELQKYPFKQTFHCSLFFCKIVEIEVQEQPLIFMWIPPTFLSIENVVCYTANLKLTFKFILRLRKYGKLLIVNWALLLMYLTFNLKQRLVVQKSWPEIYEQFTVIYYYMRMQQTLGVSWCFRRVQSPNDVIEKFEKTLKNTYTTKQDNNAKTATPRNT